MIELDLACTLSVKILGSIIFFIYFAEPDSLEAIGVKQIC